MIIKNNCKMLIMVIAKLFTIIYLINVVNCKLDKSFAGYTKDVSQCGFRYSGVDGDFRMGVTQRMFCYVYYTEYGDPASWNAGAVKGKKDDCFLCETLLTKQHLNFHTEKRDKVKEMATWCKSNGWSDLTCIALLDHFNQYCFNIELILNHIKPFASRIGNEKFIDEFYNYRVKAADWPAVSLATAKLETCTSEFYDTDRYQANVDAIKSYNKWSDGKPNITCSCNIILALQRVIDSNVVKIEGSSNEEKINKLFDVVCVPTLPDEVHNRLAQANPSSYFPILGTPFTTPLPVTGDTIINDLVKLAIYGWNSDTYDSLKFEDILPVIGYDKDDYKKRFKLVAAGILARMDLTEINGLVAGAGFAREEDELDACFNMISMMKETLRLYYAKDGLKTDIGTVVKPIRVTKAYAKQIKALFTKMLTDRTIYTKDYCLRADVKNELWVKNIIRDAFDKLKRSIKEPKDLNHTSVAAVFSELL